MVYEYISRLIPKKLLESYRDNMVYAGMGKKIRKVLGFILLFGLAISFTAGYLFFIITGVFVRALIISFISFIAFEIVTYFWISLKADSRGKQIEKVLPDALQLIAINLRSGMTTDRAIISAIKPELGPLEELLLRAGKQIMAGKPISQALSDVPLKVKSPLLKRTINLIIKGIQSGGNLAEFIEKTANDLRETHTLEEEIRATVMTYMIFIFFAAGIGAPLVFGVSTYLVGVLTTQMSHFTASQVSSVSNLPMSIPMLGQGGISPGFLTTYALLSLGVTSCFGGYIMGLIKTGEGKQGLTYIPLLLIISFSIFFITRIIISGIFKM